jgi:hypothetical protein
MLNISNLAFMAGQKVLPKVLHSLRGITPGRYPRWLPIIIIPKSPVGPGGEDREFKKGMPFKLTTTGFLLTFGGVLWYLKRRRERAELGQQVELDLFPEPPKAKKREPRQPSAGQQELWPGMRRELVFDEPVDVSTSEDPVEICMERRGWKLARMHELRDKIAEKETVGMFDDPDEEPVFTKGEQSFLEEIEKCLDVVAKRYGSLEAAGLEDVPCELCND